MMVCINIFVKDKEIKIHEVNKNTIEDSKVLYFIIIVLIVVMINVEHI